MCYICVFVTCHVFVKIRSKQSFLPTFPSVASRGVALAVSEGGEARPALRVTGEAKPTLYTAPSDWRGVSYAF